MLTAWHAARDKDLFWPWFDKSAAAALPLGIPASDQHVQQRVIDLFKADAVHAALADAVAHADVVGQVSRLSQRVRLFASPGQPSDAAAALPLPSRALTWAPVILAEIARV
jgi:hypothetical protein